MRIVKKKDPKKAKEILMARKEVMRKCMAAQDAGDQKEAEELRKRAREMEKEAASWGGVSGEDAQMIALVG